MQNKDQALANIADVSEVFGSSRWWIDCGTLLGALREGDFIDHDLDTDVGIMFDDWDFGYLRDLRERGFEIITLFGLYKNGMEIATMRGDVKTDIFFHYEWGPNQLMHATWKNGSRNGVADQMKMVHNIKDVLPLSKIKLRGVEFNAPANPEQYCIDRYGDNWRVPDAKFRWDVDPKNVI